jgi:hypothetical protein
MKLYSDFPGPRMRQVTADCAAIAGIVGFVVLGVVLHDAILALRAVGLRLTDAGSSF